MCAKVLISAGEASGDLYASELVKELRALRPDLEFFGVAGDKMQAAGVRAVVDSSALSVVGLVEVVSHIPRIYKEFRKLIRAARTERPNIAILTDSPDFNLRVARKLRRLGIPVVYLVAPQVWAWREGRVRPMRRDLDRILCIFPFEEPWFRLRGLRADYIGHPLIRIVRPSCSKQEFLQKHNLCPSRRLVILLGGSRLGEVRRHLEVLADAGARLRHELNVQTVLAVPAGFQERAGPEFFRERFSPKTIQVIDGETWDALAYGDVAVAASGTVTIEAAILGTPMVTYYKVNRLSWWMGRRLVRSPFYSMVNLVAGKKIVPEFMQDQATGTLLAEAASELLRNTAAREEMRRELSSVVTSLTTSEHPMKQAAQIVNTYLD